MNNRLFAGIRKLLESFHRVDEVVLFMVDQLLLQFLNAHKIMSLFLAA